MCIIFYLEIKLLNIKVIVPECIVMFTPDRKLTTEYIFPIAVYKSPTFRHSRFSAVNVIWTK